MIVRHATHHAPCPACLPASPYAAQTARALAAAVIPNEYGIHPAGKLRIGSMICSQLLGKLLADLASMREESVQTAGLQHADNSLLVRQGQGRAGQDHAAGPHNIRQLSAGLPTIPSCPACCTARWLLQYDVMSDLGNLEVGSGSHGGASKRAGSAGSPSAAAATVARACRAALTAAPPRKVAQTVPWLAMCRA